LRRGASIGCAPECDFVIAIIDYDAGNLPSVVRALAFLGFQCTITHDVGAIEKADRIIFPGVGAAGSAMASLKRRNLDLAIKNAFLKGTPILGICIGMQAMMDYSEENDTDCIGIVKGKVSAFSTDLRSGEERPLKIPHMGWNGLRILQPHPVLSGIRDTDEFYFVHGFYPDPEDPSCVIGVTEYGKTFASVISMGNLIATQFHPEKSGRPGLSILKQFCLWEPGYSETEKRKNRC
jgi:glutamine amidotransferase